MQCMKNMVLLIDTNILLNYLTNRDDLSSQQSREIVRMCATGECTGYIAFHTLSTIWYVLRKWDDEKRRATIALLDTASIFQCLVDQVSDSRMNFREDSVVGQRMLRIKDRQMMDGIDEHVSTCSAVPAEFTERRSGTSLLC